MWPSKTLQHEIRIALPTAEAAFHLNRQPQTLRAWVSTGTGPIKPLRINGRLDWPVVEIIRLLTAEAA